MKEIPLTKGKTAIVDDSDYLELSAYKWQFGGKGYAIRTTRAGVKKATVYMHRVIAGAKCGDEVDHINGNQIDNRRANLRVCTTSHNQMNRSQQRNNTSGYKGVSWNKRDCRWDARIASSGKQVYLGSFATAREAARAYNEAAISLHGEYAKLNDL